MKTMTPFIFVCFAACMLVGCGSSGSEVSNEKDAAVSDSNTSGGTQVLDAARGNDETIMKRRPNERWEDENGVEYLGNVPLDVFFDQPLEVASNMTPIGGGLGVESSVNSQNVADLSMQTATMSGDTSTTPEATTDGGSNNEDWAELLPAKNLLDEVNQTRSFLNSSLQSVGAYNNAMLSIPGKAACLAALAEIAISHPEDISWKDDAIYIRDLARQMNESDLQRGKKDQARLLLLFENIVDILNRSKPAGLDEPNADDSFADVAEMRLLMFRMAEAERRMKNEAGSESAFKSKKEMVQHEAIVLAALTKIISKEEFGYGDDEEFVGYAQRVMDACRTIRDSADTEAFAAYDLALSKISTNCQECHSVFKNN